MTTTQTVVEPGNGTRYWIVTGVGPDGTPFVALPSFGAAAAMEWRHYVHPGYVDDKFGRVLTWEDCVQIADALNARAAAA